MTFSLIWLAGGCARTSKSCRVFGNPGGTVPCAAGSGKGRREQVAMPCSAARLITRATLVSNGMRASVKAGINHAGDPAF